MQYINGKRLASAVQGSIVRLSFIFMTHCCYKKIVRPLISQPHELTCRQSHAAAAVAAVVGWWPDGSCDTVNR